MRLRDHSQPCEHGFDQYHWLLDGNLCPGGRIVTIDYEAAETELLATVFMLDKGDSRANPVDAARAIIAAALGDTEDE